MKDFGVKAGDDGVALVSTGTGVELRVKRIPHSRRRLFALEAEERHPLPPAAPPQKVKAATGTIEVPDERDARWFREYIAGHGADWFKAYLKERGDEDYFVQYYRENGRYWHDDCAAATAAQNTFFSYKQRVVAIHADVPAGWRDEFSEWERKRLEAEAEEEYADFPEQADFLAWLDYVAVPNQAVWNVIYGVINSDVTQEMIERVKQDVFFRPGEQPAHR